MRQYPKPIWTAIIIFFQLVIIVLRAFIQFMDAPPITKIDEIEDQLTNMQHAEKRNSLIFRVEAIENLPPFPLLANILRSFSSADSAGDLRPLVANIESEPSIAAKIIGSANAAFFASGASVNSVKDAVTRVGLSQLKMLVFSLVVASRFDTKPCPAFEISRFWFDAMTLAHCSSHLADESRKMLRIDGNELYCIGLLHSIGILALIHLSPIQMNEIFLNHTDHGLAVEEQQVFEGIDHFDVGAALLRHWHLPKQFYDVILECRDEPLGAQCSVTAAIVTRAKELIESDFTTENPILDTKLGLTPEMLQQVEAELRQDQKWIETFANNF